MRAMSIYVKNLLSQRDKRSSSELVWELQEALEEKQASGAALSAEEETTLRLCRVENCDGIREILDDDRDALRLAAEFARQRGLTEKARILSDAHAGKPVPGGFSMSAVMGGIKKVLDVPQDEWGATDIALSLGEEDLASAILDFVGEHLERIAPEAPAAVAAKAAGSERIAAFVAGRGAVELVEELLAHRQPIVRARLTEPDRGADKPEWLDVPVAHQYGAPASARVIAQLRSQYGAVADSLLDIYARHDGLALFVAEGEPGFMFLPIAEWEESLAHVMDWTRMTWEDDPDEMPDYLEASIAFGYIPGDSERWVLVTRGKHAGKVMLSESDAIEDDPRIESVSALVATLILEPARVLGCGGFVSYGDEPRYYPEQYIHS